MPHTHTHCRVCEHLLQGKDAEHLLLAVYRINYCTMIKQNSLFYRRQVEFVVSWMSRTHIHAYILMYVYTHAHTDTYSLWFRG